METIWGRAQSILREVVGERSYRTWIDPIRCAAEDDGAIRLEVPNRFFHEWVSRHFLEAIRAALGRAGAAPGNVRLIIRVGDDDGDAVPKGPLSARESPRQRRPALGHLVPQYTFSTFVVGESNRMAHEAARAVALEPGRRFNPFFIHGGVGLGKTHLINAVAHEILGRPRRTRMACLSAEAFMNNLITSLRQDQMAAFRDRYRQVDALILDDVQFLAGKERTQEEFFHTFNALHNDGKQIILTSDKPPSAIAGLEQRLKSRFDGGLTADILPPSVELRVAIARRKATDQGVSVSADVATYIARRSGASVRELEGALTRVLACAALGQRPITLELAQEAMASFGEPALVVSMEDVLERVGVEFGLNAADLKSHRRMRTLTLPRQLAMYLCRSLAGASFPAIGEKFGGRDHSTVMHAVRVVEGKREADPATASLLTRLEANLGRGFSGANRLPGEPRHEPREP